MFQRWEKCSVLYADMAFWERENAKVNWAVVVSGCVPSHGMHRHIQLRKRLKANEE